MSTTQQPWPRAWEPLTPRGVAAFAAAPLLRLLLVQLIVALLAAGAVAWFLESSWLPIVRTAIRQLPAEGEIRDEQLDWRGAASVALAGNHFLGIGVDVNHSGQLGREAQLQVEFGRKNVRVFSMLGYQVIDYPPGWRMAFNRTELDPWWGAREPWLVVSVAALTAAGLLVSWFLLATLYCVPVKLITLFENRDLGWGQSWRLAGAALMPGALFLTAGIVACGFNLVDLIQLGGLGVLHVVVGWIYLFISPLFLPRPVEATIPKANPFAEKKGPPLPAPKKDSNPFKTD
jgi:hypothetical protein